MLNCDWGEVHYFIQRERDAIEDRFSVDKILTKTMETYVEEPRSKDYKEVITKVVPELSRKPKMKIKAAKVFKSLLNFLQIKPKRKYEDTEQLCIPATPQDSFAYENPGGYQFGPLQTPNSTTCHKPDGILSRSWSYLVHDPFKEVSSLGEETKNIENGVFYDDSYFEDDYCQDYRENDWTQRWTPCGDENMSYSNRLFEPERTPCGEFRRSVVTRGTPCRRHASLPNFLVDSQSFSSGAAANEADLIDSSEPINVDDFMTDHPLVGLNIAFDNVLDETNCDRTVYSVNTVPCIPTVIDQFEENCDKSVSETYKCNPEVNLLDCSVSERTSTDITPTNYCIASDSIHNLKVSGQPGKLARESGEMKVSEVPSSSERCTLDTVLAANCASRYRSLKRVSHDENSTGHVKITSKQYGSVESGYSSCESSPTGSPDILSQAVVKDTNPSNPYTLPVKPIDILSVSKVGNIFTYKQLDFSDATQLDLPDVTNRQSPNTVSTSAGQRREITNVFKASTSSPMQIINTPTFLNTTQRPVISPITQNAETPKMRLSTADSCGSLKINRHHRRNKSIAKVSNFQSRFLESNAQTNTIAKDPFNEDHLLLTTAADLILNRIQFKEELQSYIKMEDLVAYLKSYYMTEIAKLSNRNVQSISDFRKITKEACDMFTSDRLTPESCYCELLTAILANRPGIVAACEGFVFENYEYFIRSRDFFEAAPELILMLLCNNRSTIYGVIGLPMRFGDLGLDLNTHLDKYIEKQRNETSRTYFRAKNMFTRIHKKRTDLSKVNSLARKICSKVSSKVSSDQEFARELSYNRDCLSTLINSMHSTAMSNVQREPLQNLSTATSMVGDKQLLFKTQGNVPETTQKLLDYVGSRKIPNNRRSSYQSRLSLANIQNTLELDRRHSANVGKYNLLSNSALPSGELRKTRNTSGKSFYAARPTYDSKKLTFSRPAVEYITVV